MADIFISYSSKDHAQAEQLTELLASAGLSVWIDKQGIGAATSWSEEIVNALDACTAFVVMLSPSSIESKNVVREVALAFEKNKKILPLDLEPVTLPASMQYHLAGLQRTSMTNIDSIIRALGKLGLEATQAPTMKLVKETDSRKSLMILPFEDLSPTQDNGWFTDGIASELVNTLSKVKAVRVIDWNTSSLLRNRKVRTTELAKDFSVRYFIEGQVLKFGDKIKISVNLLDIETGDHLWQDNLRGTIEDIFEIQERTAQKVLDGLKIHLTAEEKRKIESKPTENAEAYELHLKANEYYNRHTKADYERALSLREQAVRLDPGFTAVYCNIAITCMAIYHTYDRSERWLERQERAAEKVKELDGESAPYLSVMSGVSLMRGNTEDALELALRSVETDPEYAVGYGALAFAHKALRNKAEAVKAREANLRLLPNDTTTHFNLIVSLNELGDPVRLREAAEHAIPVFERYLRLNPDDHNARVQYASLLCYADRTREALVAADEFSSVEILDGRALYNLACVYLHCNVPERGMEQLRRSVKKGFNSIEIFRRDPDLNPLREREDFKVLMNALEEKQSG